MKISSEGDGARMRFSPPEAAMLTGLLDATIDDLRPDALDRADPVHQRLFQSGYREQGADEHTFRELTEPALRDERIGRAQRCRADLQSARTAFRGSDLHLDADAADRWTRVLNDIRLALGTRLGINDEHDYALHRGDPQLRQRVHYVWLTTVQDLLVQSLMQA
jgi:hypothetical protein